MDEPLSNLDAKLRNQMRSEIIKLRQRINTTFIYVTHDQTEAMTLGDRIVIMKDGFVQQVGTPREVFSHPANVFVAGFIGTPQMNFFDARLVREGQRYFVELESARVELSREKQARLLAGDVDSQDVVLGVRPEHMIITRDDNAVPAAVDVSEMMGSAVHIHVSACGRDIIIIVPVSEDEEEARRAVPQMGTPVRFTFHGGAAHVFHKESGVNLERFPDKEDKKADSQPLPEENAPAAVSAGVGDPFAEA